MLYAVLVVALVVLDQVVKFLVRANIPLGGDVPFLPHILHLTYVQNTGAAFSLLEEHTWILTIVSLVVSVLLVVLLVKKVFPRPFAMAALSMVLAGAVGNLIDRALLGYVTDMFETLFMRFAVFNGRRFPAWRWSDPAAGCCRPRPRWRPVRPSGSRGSAGPAPPRRRERTPAKR